MPRFGEDVRNVTLIAGSAAVGLAVTAALFAANAGPRRVVRVAPIVDLRIERAAPRVVEAPHVVTNGAERLYGEVATTDGRHLEGFLRWDANEGSWADLLDAIKPSGRNGVDTQTGVRFGHIARIRPTGSRTAEVEMRSGEVVELRGSSTDLGSGLRALAVESSDGTTERLSWGDLVDVRFHQAPTDATSTEQRLHGEIETRSGQHFTGFIAWDVDEIYASDILDGETSEGEIDVPFGAIESITREDRRGVRVTLIDGETFRMTGSDDVDSGNAGLTVSDPALGQIAVDWADVEHVRFFPPETLPERDSFDASGPVRATVIGSSGDSWTGAVTWDADESRGWDILNGHDGDADFFVEFGQVRRITKTAHGASVTLRDGRTFELSGSQDVDSANRGIRIDTPAGAHTLSWRDFRELRIER